MASKRRGLGKGLSALIPDEPKALEEEISEKDRVVNIDIAMIEPNREQPRREFNSDAIIELSKSIQTHGVLQPIIVRKADEGYQLVAGERRWRAAKEAGFKEIPCLIKDLEQKQSTEIALIENIQREDLNPIEESIAYKELMEKHNLTQEEVAEVVGKSRSYIANTTRLLNLDKKVIDLILKDQLTRGHGRTLLSLEEKEQIKVAQIIIEKQLSVRETERLVKTLLKSKESKKRRTSAKDPILLDIEDTLRNALGTKVNINKGKNKGKIEIEYYSDEDLERIVEYISKL